MSGVSCAAVVMFIVRRVIANKTYHKQYTQVKDGIPLGPYLYGKNFASDSPVLLCLNRYVYGSITGHIHAVRY